MNKKFEILFGFTVIILVVVGFIVAGISTIPSKSEVDAAAVGEKITMPVDISQLKVFQQIKQLERNGDVPVIVNESELGNTNPFSPL